MTEEVEPLAKRRKLDEPSQEESLDSSPLASPTKDRTSRANSAPRGRGKGKRSKGSSRPQHRHVGWTENEASEKKDQEPCEKAERRPKRKVVVYLGYVGTAYSGLQINKGVKTIEGTLFDCLVTAGCVSEDNADDPLKIGLHRAARTDSGVHAAINMLSMKLILDPASKEPEMSIVDYINSHLPDDLRVWRIVRVQNSFNPRTLCDARTYHYTFPSFLLLPPKPGTLMSDKLVSLAGSAPWPAALHQSWHENAEGADWYSPTNAWRVPNEVLNRFRELLACMLGSHNFHNFTVGATFADRSSTRVMKELTLLEPKVTDGVEWLTIELLGQSFMLHQIRKMVGLLILACRSPAPVALIPELFGPIKVIIPRAPAIGLRLQRPHFDRYNRKVADTPSLKDPNDHRDELDFPPAMCEQVDAWVSANIEPRMHNAKAFVDWQKGIDENTKSELDYLNSAGVVPVRDKTAQPEAQPLNALDGEEGDQTARGGADDQEG